MLKNILRDPVVYFLLIVNSGLAFAFFQQIISKEIILYTYYFQSLIIGLSHFFQIITCRNYSVKNLTINGKQVDKSAKTKGCISLFFIFHYGFFHLVYLIFLLIKVRFPMHSEILISSVLAFGLGELTGIIRQNMIPRSEEQNIGILMFTPYLRILPMHLFIMAGGFFGYDHSGIFAVFIILKILSDIIMHIIANKTYRSFQHNGEPPIIQL